MSIFIGKMARKIPKPSCNWNECKKPPVRGSGYCREHQLVVLRSNSTRNINFICV